MTYLPGDRVTFGATLGDLAGTVEALHGDDVHCPAGRRRVPADAVAGAGAEPGSG
ncbi:MAG TPA: hypothetical protein VGI99_12750 [Gemmataceae bacterium]